MLSIAIIVIKMDEWTVKRKSHDILPHYRYMHGHELVDQCGLLPAVHKCVIGKEESLKGSGNKQKSASVNYWKIENSRRTLSFSLSLGTFSVCAFIGRKLSFYLKSAAQCTCASFNNHVIVHYKCCKLFAIDCMTVAFTFDCSTCRTRV